MKTEPTDSERETVLRFIRDQGPVTKLQIRRGLPQITAKWINQSVSELIWAGLVERVTYEWPVVYMVTEEVTE